MFPHKNQKLVEYFVGQLINVELKLVILYTLFRTLISIELGF